MAKKAGGRKGQPASDSAKRWSVHGGESRWPERAARERQREALERAWRRKQTGRKGQPASEALSKWPVTFR